MESTVYSMRAESLAEVTDFVLHAHAQGLTLEQYRPLPPHHYGGVGLEFSTTATLDELKAVISGMPEGQTMLETIRPVPLSRNTLERDVITP